MSKDIANAINNISKLPGLGPRSAKRLILHLLQNKDELMVPILHTLSLLAESVVHCTHCGNLDQHSVCSLCNNQNRDHTTLCIVEDIIDLWALERGRIYNGIYHVLGCTLSAIDGIGPDKLNINTLERRIKQNNIKEVIIAINTTVEGQTTAHYIIEFIRAFSQVTISSLANGIPMGGEMDYLDEGTLSIALNSRRKCV